MSSFDNFSESYSPELTNIVREMVFSQSFDDELTFSDLTREFPNLDDFETLDMTQDNIS